VLREVDLLLPEGAGVRPVEIKSGATLQRDACGATATLPL
jgi:hypothetical protein